MPLIENGINTLERGTGLSNERESKGFTINS